MTDTDALLATVRQAVQSAMNGEWGRQNALAALDSLAAELERVKAERDERCPVCFYNEWELEYDFGEGDEVEIRRCQNCGWPPTYPATVEEHRRKHFISPYLLDLEEMVKLREARLDKALSALREIAEDTEPNHYSRLQGIARAAIQEIEG